MIKFLYLCIFFLKWTTIIVTAGIFMIFNCFRKDESKWIRISYIFRVKVFSKYTFWASTYMLFWALCELSNFSEISSSYVISYIITIIIMLVTSVLSYCFIIYPKEKWWIWSRYTQINKIRLDFLLLDILNSSNYKLIIRYNLVRKLILSVTFAIQLKYKMPPFIFTFVIIFVQVMYSNIIMGWWQFKSSVTAWLIIFNEIPMITIVQSLSNILIYNVFERNWKNYMKQ